MDFVLKISHVDSVGVRDQAFPLTGVFVEFGQLTEAEVAGGAPVRPLSSVRPQVDRQVALLRKAVAAVRARERLLARVAADVPHQRGPPAEALPAGVASVRPLARVDPHVHPEVALQREALPADAAAERRLPVDSEVVHQAFFVLQLHTTHATVLQMSRRVCEKVTRPLKGFATNFAAEHRRKLSVQQISRVSHLFSRTMTFAFCRLLWSPRSCSVFAVLFTVLCDIVLGEELFIATCCCIGC